MSDLNLGEKIYFLLQISFKGALEPKHTAPIPTELPIKKDESKDILLIMTDHIKVTFKLGKKSETLMGRWCLTCK